MNGERGPALGFVAPALDGPPTGGTLYNAALIAALQRAGVRCTCWELSAAPHELAGDWFFVDSLYLEALPDLQARAGHARVAVLLHWLPSLVSTGAALTREQLTPKERHAIDHAGGVLVTSPFMQQVLVQLGWRDRPLLCVEPGVELPPPPPRSAATDGVRAVMLCNLTEGKGVLPFLTALAHGLAVADRFTLDLAGALDADSAYTAACRTLLRAQPALAARVRLLGALPHPQALALLQTADVFLSSSRMESHGMALAEARAAGVPILARSGGHTAAHVDPATGGELVPDEPALAARFLALTRSPASVLARTRLAATHRLTRSWDTAATELLAALARAR